MAFWDEMKKACKLSSTMIQTLRFRFTHYTIAAYGTFYIRVLRFVSTYHLYYYYKIPFYALHIWHSLCGDFEAGLAHLSYLSLLFFFVPFQGSSARLSGRMDCYVKRRISFVIPRDRMVGWMVGWTGGWGCLSEGLLGWVGGMAWYGMEMRRGKHKE